MQQITGIGRGKPWLLRTRRAPQAIVLAAGTGSRLRAGGLPKCLVPVAGRPLIAHQLDALNAVGIRDVLMVVGHQHHHVTRVVGPRARYVQNPRFAETNSMYSFLQARDHVRGDIVVMNSDVLFPPAVLRALLSRRSSAIAYDSSSGQEDEHMKVEVSGHRLVAMSKELEPARSGGENLGVLLLRGRAVDDVFGAAADFVDQGHERGWLPIALSSVAHRNRFDCVDVAGLPWIEIDYPEDLQRARTEVWPAMRGAFAEPRKRRLVHLAPHEVAHSAHPSP